MSWVTPTQAAELARSGAKIALLGELRFRSGTMYVWNGDTFLSSGGRLWQPLRGAAMVDGIPVGGSLQAESVTLTLSGISSLALAGALDGIGDVSQQLAFLSFQLFTPNWAVYGGPLQQFYGYMQPPRISRDPINDKAGAQQLISVECVNAFYNRSRPPRGRYTDSDQRKRSSSDQFFSFIAGTVRKVVVYPDY